MSVESLSTLNKLVCNKVEVIEDLVGMYPLKVEATNDELKIYFSEFEYARFYHRQDCCETVQIESIVGDLNDLVGEQLMIAEEVSGDTVERDMSEYESYTWTFYKFATRKGYVDIRWLGTSNGYYGEQVDFEVVDTRC